MLLTQILQKIKSAFYTKSETDTKLSTKANSSDLNNYLPLSGGMLTGFDISRNVENEELRINGGTELDSGGASLIVYGKDSTFNPGGFTLRSFDGTGYKNLMGTNDNLSWCGKNVDCIDSQGDGYIRYTNGIQICWGNGLFVTDTEITYPKPFSGWHKMSIQATAGNIADLNVSTQSWEPTRFILKLNSSREEYVAWQAIGTWK